MRAKRSVFKLFLSHLHQAGCELHGIPYKKPYQFDILKHEHFIDWKHVIAVDMELSPSDIKKLER